MRSLVSLSFSIAIFLVMGACSQLSPQTSVQPVDQYFTQLAGIISPYLSYQGRGELSQAQAQGLKHYRFSYDTQGRIKEIAFFDQDKPNAQAYFGAHKVVYHYATDTLIRSYFGVGGGKSTFWRHYYLGDNLHQELFLLDQAGKKKSLVLLDSLGHQVATGLGSYRFEFETLNDSQFVQRQFTQAGSAKVLTGYFPFPTSLITKDKRGYLYSITNLDESGKPAIQPEAGYAKVIFDFDEYGNELGWSFHDTSGKPANRLAAHDMDHGFAQVRYDFTWKDHSLGLYHAFVERYFAADGNAVPNNLGIHQIQYYFTETSEIQSMAYYGLRDSAVMHPSYGFHRIEYAYDSLGIRTGTQRFDARGNVL